MAVEFHAARNPSEELCAEVAALDPANPFYTAQFVEAMRLLKSEPWVLSLRRDGRLISACTAFMKSGRLSRSLEITSLPTLPHGDAFWGGLLEFCRKSKVTHLVVSSFASAEANVPALPGETWRGTRCEYVLDLDGGQPHGSLSSNHRRNIKNAKKIGVELRRATGERACSEHASLVLASMRRRESRGETVLDRVQVDSYMALTRSGAGEIYQGVLGDKVLSSILILRAERGAYYQSAGTSPEGMACGASHLVVHGIAESLRGESVPLLNLGGADQDNPGLQRFKTGFGTRRVELASAEFYLGGRINKKLGTVVGLLRENPRGVISELGRLEKFVVYVARPSRVPPPSARDELALKKLSDEELIKLSESGEDLKAQADRYRELGFNDAFGIFCEGKLAHVSWLVTAEHDRALPTRNVMLRAGEAEITHCVTLPEFRGRGLYPHAIRGLCRVASERGIERVFMITNHLNVASQRGIEKAGFVRRGKIIRLVCPHLPMLSMTVYRGHRWGFGRSAAAG